MTLIVEDGTIVDGAESFATVAQADTYLSDRGMTTWAPLQDVEKEQALRRATDYMEAFYGHRWKGHRKSPAQALSWPRVCVFMFAEDVVPAIVQRACIELAFRAAAGDLAADLGAQVQSETVGSISTTYALGARQQTKYQAVDMMLISLFGSPEGMIKLVRG